MPVTSELSGIRRLAYEGAVDADGHVLEPPDLWERYLEARFRDRALRIVHDDDGLEELEIGGQRSAVSTKGMPSLLGVMGAPDLMTIALDPSRTYVSEASYGSMDATERLRLLDAEGLDAAVLYPTLGLLWEAELDDAELSQAYTRAYNRWICEFCAGSNGRLIPTAHLSLTDPEAAADWTGARLQLMETVRGPDGVRHQFAACFDLGLFERFPRLRLLILESGGSWVGHYLDRMDAVFEHTPIYAGPALKEKPSDYFREHCWVSCDPDEHTLAPLIERYGADRFLWASDYPHADHSADYLQDLENLAAALPDHDRRQFLGDNVRALFSIEGRRA